MQLKMSSEKWRPFCHRQWSIWARAPLTDNDFLDTELWVATFPWQSWLCLITRPHIDSKEPLNTRAWTKWSSSCRRLFKCIFMNSQFVYFAWNLINFIPKGPNDNKSALVRWWLVAEQSASHFLNQWWYCMLTCSLPQCVKLYAAFLYWLRPWQDTGSLVSRSCITMTSQWTR